MSKHSPLDASHRALGAKMVDFGGWDMPLVYADGTLAEHTRCRTEAVVFDASHLGTVRVSLRSRGVTIRGVDVTDRDDAGHSYQVLVQLPKGLDPGVLAADLETEPHILHVGWEN